ncbi:MAG TPA: type II secretion system F family protein [Gaiellaceae bacterium]|nr:type II secretion system F family protein [Gaiellaceae bacterium]
MKRAAIMATAAAVASVLAGSAGAANSSGVRVVEAKGPAFPVRTFVITLPSDRKLTIHGVTVTENGSSVLDPTLVPASQADKKTFGTVLVRDTSYSMSGKPIAAAIAAEKAFAAQRNPNEQLGMIDFNKTPTKILPLTASQAKIDAALAMPPQIAVGTHLYDAVAEAEQMLADANIGSGSIVVLSDGADTGSTKTLSQVAGGALNSNTKIYTVGLADASYNPGALKALAKQGHGEYTKASAGSLTPLFEQLSQQISNEYLLQYKSLEGPNKPVRVEVNVRGLGTTSTGYRTPALPKSQTVPAPYKPSIGTRIADSSITMVLVALLLAAIVGFLVIGLLQPKRSGLPARMAEFVSIRGLQRDKGEPAAATEDAGQPKSFWTRFEETLEIAEIKIEPEWIVAGTFALTALTFLLVYAATGSGWWALFAFVIPYLSREWVVRTLARRRNRFAEQLPDALQVIASALRSGHSFAGALAVVVESASEPMKSEMQRVVADEQRGVPIQDSLGVVADRMASRDVEQLALVAQLQREAGGDAAEVVDRVAETVRERFDLRRLIQTLTMQGRMSRWIVSILPIVIVLAVLLENPHYFHPLIDNLGGRILLGFAAAWAVAGSFVIKRIVEIEV